MIQWPTLNDGVGATAQKNLIHSLVNLSEKKKTTQIKSSRVNSTEYNELVRKTNSRLSETHREKSFIYVIIENWPQNCIANKHPCCAINDNCVE